MKKTFLNTSRLLVGVLFIFSGLIKANDPLGLSYKMQEFFEVWNLAFLDHYSLGFSIIMIVFEILAGVAVLLGWRMRLFAWLLLLLIIFFSFLTGLCCDLRKDQGMWVLWKLHSTAGHAIVHQRPDPALTDRHSIYLQKRNKVGLFKNQQSDHPGAHDRIFFFYSMVCIAISSIGGLSAL